jgi:hypothetical protein
VEKAERLKKMKEEQERRELAVCKQFKGSSRALVSRSEDGKRVLVGIRLYEVLLGARVGTAPA